MALALDHAPASLRPGEWERLTRSITLYSWAPMVFLAILIGSIHGFPLIGKHATIKCKSCHEDKTKGYPTQQKKAGLDWLRGALASNGPMVPHAKDQACAVCRETVRTIWPLAEK